VEHLTHLFARRSVRDRWLRLGPLGFLSAASQQCCFPTIRRATMLACFGLHRSIAGALALWVLNKYADHQCSRGLESFFWLLIARGCKMAVAQNRTVTLPGVTLSGTESWEPALLLREQTSVGADRHRPILYIHGGTFDAANSMMFKFDGVSWADALNAAGRSVWGLDFAGFGGSELYPEMAQPEPPAGEPLGRAPEAAAQIARAVRAILGETGASRVSIIAHSWGTTAAGLFATQHPELVDRIVFFGPIVRREIMKGVPTLGPWRFLTVEEQHKRFVEDLPAGHVPVLLERHFAEWSVRYLESDPTSATRSPPSVRTPNGPVADIMDAWSGSLPYDPAMIKSPLAIVRGEWDGLCKDADAAWLLAALTSAPQKIDSKIAKGTHLMHLEESRGELYRVSIEFLQAN
jgi:pimeloyl-ACP methyl ester carboxylesterase